MLEKPPLAPMAVDFHKPAVELRVSEEGERRDRDSALVADE